MFRKLIAAIVRYGDRYNREQQECAKTLEEKLRSNSSLERIFGDAQPALVAFKIDNGYVVRKVDTNNMHLGEQIIGGFWYCKDQAEIAEHIVTEAARERLGVAKQHMIQQHQPLSAAQPQPVKSSFPTRSP